MRLADLVNRNNQLPPGSRPTMRHPDAPHRAAPGRPYYIGERCPTYCE